MDGMELSVGDVEGVEVGWDEGEVEGVAVGEPDGSVEIVGDDEGKAVG